MSSEFPKLQKKLDELRWKFEQELQEVIENEGLEDVELIISDTNFIPRSPITKVAYSLRERLNSCFLTKEEYKILQEEYDNLTKPQRNNLSKEDCAKFKIEIGAIKLWEITEEHISSAQALMKIGRYQETAIRVLTEGLLLTGYDKKDIRKLASEALSECGSEIAMFDANSKNETSSLYVNEGQNCGGGKTYHKLPNGDWVCQ